MHMQRAPALLVSRRPSLAYDQRGFTLIEATIAMVIFLIVATGLAGLLASGVKQHSLTRQKTLAKEEALTQIEKIRRYPYTNLGFVGGNPSGTIPAAEASKQISLTVGGTGTTGTMATQIAWMNDPTPTSYATAANYKRITVTVTRNLDSKQLIRSVTYVAPSTRAPYGGINNAIINATITDYALSTPLENATVSLGAGPSAPLSDITGATGVVTFPALTPTTGAQPFYNVTAALAGYDTMPEDLPPGTAARFALAPAQTKNTGIRLFKPATIFVNIPNPTQGEPAGTCINFWIYVGSSRRSERKNIGCGFSGTYTITTISNASGSEKIIPGVSYTIGVLKETSPGPSRYYAPSTTASVPSGYPTTLSTTFTTTLGSALATRGLTVQVRKSGSPVIGTRVDVQGGPSPGYYLTGVTNGSGNALFDVPQTGNPCTTAPISCYTVTAWNASATGTGQALNTQVSGNSVITVNVP